MNLSLISLYGERNIGCVDSSVATNKDVELGYGLVARGLLGLPG